jgi:hypothetical protein
MSEDRFSRYCVICCQDGHWPLAVVDAQSAVTVKIPQGAAGIRQILSTSPRLLRQLKKSWPGHRPEFALRWFAGLLAA